MPAIGYARVSTPAQNPTLRNDAFTADGCARILTDTASGAQAAQAAQAARADRAAAVDYLRPDDVLVVWRHYRLGRNLGDLSNTVTTPHCGMQFRSLRESIGAARGTIYAHLSALAGLVPCVGRQVSATGRG